MAKRKGNRILKPLTFTSEPKQGDPILDFRYQREAFALTSKDLKRLESDYKGGTLSEKALAVLEDLAGGDIEAYFEGRTSDDPALLEANALLVGIDDTNPPEEIREASEAALKLCEYCYDARALLATLYPYDEGMEYYLKGIEIAEKQFADVLPELGKKGDLWKHRAARDYMRFLRDLVYYQIMHHKLEEATETCKTILELDQNDHQGIRQTLFLLHLISNNRDDLALWLDKYPNDWLLGTHVARAGMEIMNEVDTLPRELAEEIVKSSEKKKRKMIIEHMPLSQQAIRELEKRSSYVCTFLSSPAIVEFPECDEIHYQQADEAAETAKSFYAFWKPFIFPIEVLYSMEVELPKNPTKRDLKMVRQFYRINKEIMENSIPSHK